MLSVLTTASTEVEAAIIVERLAAADILASVEGGLTAGFRAEAPGSARVLVQTSDLDRAVGVLRGEAPASPTPRHPPTEPGPLVRRRFVAATALIAVLLILLILLSQLLT